MNAHDESMAEALEVARDKILEEKSLVQIIAEDENLSTLIEYAFNRSLGVTWQDFDDAIETHLADLAKAVVDGRESCDE